MKTLKNLLSSLQSRSDFSEPNTKRVNHLDADTQYHVVLGTDTVDLSRFGVPNNSVGIAVATASYSKPNHSAVVTHTHVLFQKQDITLSIPESLLRTASSVEVSMGGRISAVFTLQRILGEYHWGAKPYNLYLDMRGIFNALRKDGVYLVEDESDDALDTENTLLNSWGNFAKGLAGIADQITESRKEPKTSGLHTTSHLDLLTSTERETVDHKDPNPTIQVAKDRKPSGVIQKVVDPILSWDSNEEVDKADTQVVLANGTTIPKEALDSAKAKAQEYVDSLPKVKQGGVSISASYVDATGIEIPKDLNRAIEKFQTEPPVFGNSPVTGRSQSKVPNESNVPKPNPNFVPATKGELLERAMKNIGMLDRDAGLEDLGGERVQVDDKAMINCRADLNQLVPFKYEWAWQAYLKATENHWMPLEVSLEKDVIDWVNCTPDESKLIQLALYNLETYSSFNTNDPLLAIYRFLTNPEARQYILRQRFELTVWGNFVHNAIDNFNYQFPVEKVTNPKNGKVVENCDWYSFNDKNYESFLKREQIKAKLDTRKLFEIHIGDNKFDPQDTTNDKVGIVERIIMYYICHGFIFNFASLIQLVGLKDKNKFAGLSTGANNILRDVALHTGAGILILRQIFAENPELMSKDICKHLMQFIHKACDAEIEYMDWYANSDLPNAKSSDQIQTLKYMVNRFTEELGIGTAYPETERFAKCADFVVTYDAHLPNLHGGGSSVLGSGGALSFDEDTSETADEK